MIIASLPTALSQSQVQQQASISVTKMAMGNAEQQGQAVEKLLSTNNNAVSEHVARPHLGGNIDMKG